MFFFYASTREYKIQPLTNELLNLYIPQQFILTNKGEGNPRSTSPSGSSDSMYIILWPTVSVRSSINEFKRIITN